MSDRFGNALNEALKTGNYERVNTIVAETVSTVLSEAGKATSKTWTQRDVVKNQAKYQEEYLKRQTEARERARAARAQQEQWRAQQAQQAQQRQVNGMTNAQTTAVAKAQTTAVAVKNKGMVPGILMVVFGSIANIPLFVLILVGLALEWGAVGALTLSWLLSILCIGKGKSKIQLVNKAKRYVKLCGTKMFAEVEELASRVGSSPKKVQKELRKILQKGILPSAHLDQKGTHLMLNDTVYKQYADAEKSRLLREKEEKEQAKLEGRKQKAIETKEEPKGELAEMIAEGQVFIEKIHYMNDLIPGDEISAKLYRLEDLLKEIFRRLEKEPAQLNRMHKVMNYYLPTTLKLLESYHEFDMVSAPNEEIISAKAEIERTIDTINEAFVELLNSLFQPKVFDVTADAQVLQTMLASEGLTKEMDINNVGK